MPRKSSRRGFLTGQSAIDAIDDLTLPVPGGGLPRPASAPRPAGAPRGESEEQEETLLLHIGREAMACQFEVLLNAKQYPLGAEAAVAALDRIDELEGQLTVYRDLSEVQHINKTAAERPVPVETGLFQLLARACELHTATNGAFDITSGPLTKIWGFYRRQGNMPSAAEIEQALQCVDCRLLELNPASEEVRFLKPGLELNLGAIGKGYALDRGADVLLAQGVEDFCFHGGMSSVLARGQRRRSGQQGWQVALRHPLRPDARLATFCLENQALGTSGSGTQFFHHRGKRYGHILDPRSGWPADKVLSATVIAPNAEQADALSTACYVLGVDEAGAFLKTRPEIAALLVTAERGEQLTLHTFQLPSATWEICDAGKTPSVRVVPYE